MNERYLRVLGDRGLLLYVRLLENGSAMSAFGEGGFADSVVLGGLVRCSEVVTKSVASESDLVTCARYCKSSLVCFVALSGDSGESGEPLWVAATCSDVVSLCLEVLPNILKCARDARRG
jgi:hypothetical protein